MSSITIPATSTSLVEAINFLTYPLSLTLPHLTVNSLQQVLLSTLTTVPAWLRNGRLILTFSISAPPRPIFAACVATQLDWSHWYYALGGREFDLVVEQTAVSVWVAGISGHAEVWKQASDPYPPFAPSITTFSPEPHVPITQFGRPSTLNKVTPSLVQSQTVAQQLLQSDHEKEEADEIFAMISSLDACLISPTPTHERFSLPNASIAKAPILSRLAPLPALDEEVFHSCASLRQPTFTRDHHVFSPISSPELSCPNSPYSSNSYSSSRESLTSISSTQSSVCSPLEASAKPFVQASKITASAPRSSSIPPAQAPKSQVQRYLYQGGQSTVLTGGVMLGAAGKAPISRTSLTVGYKSRSSGGKGKTSSTGTQTLPVRPWRRAAPTRI